MLILKRVEIQGFKSFADRTEMRFSGKGVAAVVGPNGCGKSNIADSINWVLGEQSAKTLRGSNMQDVIFAGTRERKPLGMAQVTLVMVDPTGRTAIPGLRPEAVKEQARGRRSGKPEAQEAAAEGAESAPAAESVTAANEAVNGATEAGAPVEVIEVKTNGHSNGFSLAHPGKEQEISVTRRLFRSGESEYLINGRPCRLRDIQELFMGTGLGPESYAIIEQGRIGQVLMSKPLERRGVIEEAAGISKFKTKRRLAEAKLESAKQNLSRVFDILEEVGRQVNSLKRQAGKAKRYEELKSGLDEQLRTALAGRYFLLEREAARVSQALEAATRGWHELQQKVEAEEEALRQARETLYQVESDLTAARQKLSEVKLEAERTRGQIESQVKQVAGIEQRLEQGEADNEQLGERLGQLDQEHLHLAEQLEEFELQANDARERLQAKQAERAEREGDLRERERVLEGTRQQVVRLLGEAATLRNQTAQIDAYLQSVERDEARIRREEEAVNADLARLEEQKKDLSARLSTRQMDLESVQDRRQRVEGELAERREAVKATRGELERSRAELFRVKSRRDSLDEILSHRSYTTETVKRLFTAVEQKQVDGFHPAGVLADFVELTDPMFEKATEEFLHEELEYVVVKQWDDAQRGLELMRSDLDGRATFLVEPSLNGDASSVLPAAAPEPPIGPETGIVGRLSEGLRFTNGLTNAPAALLPRLARCYLAENRDAARRLSLQYPDLYFLLSDGVCYHGHAVSGGRHTGSGPLALKRELRELSAAYQRQQASFAEAEERLKQFEADAQLLAEQLEELRAEQQKQEKETLVLEQEMRKVSEELNRANQKLSVARLELERLARDGARAREQRAEKQALVETHEQQRAEMEGRLEQGRAELEESKGEVARLAEEHSVLRVELAGFEERKRGIENALERLGQQSREVAARRQQLGEEMGRLAASRTRLLELNLTLDAKAQQLAEEEAHFQQRVAEMAGQEATCRTKLAAHEEELKALRNSASEAQESRGQVEVELVRRQSDLKYLDETSRKELDTPVADLARAQAASLAAPQEPPSEITLEALEAALRESMAAEEAAETAARLLEALAQAESDEEKEAARALALEALCSAAPAAAWAPDEMAVAEAEERVAELRKKIEALGGVNPEAWREFQEAQQRYDFLNSQRQDLLDSIKDTDQAIKEIDTESRKRFAEAFEIINENFRQTFQTLFGGGTGEMRLIGEGDQLEQGIEIVAQPPGKRLQNVQLLSGGEKALTAMALLMGIFRYQPSPFCILDEVDAPLDEANVGRFTNLIKELAAQTQFIVITHAKKTMEAAETLYGVTMQEQGISKLVSVRLQAPPPPPAAAEAQVSALPN